MRSAAVAIPLARNRFRRAAGLVAAALAVVAGIAWSIYAAAGERGDLGYPRGLAESTGRVLLVAVGLLALRILLTRPQLMVGNHALAIVAPLRFARPVAIAREHVQAILFDAGNLRLRPNGGPPVIGDENRAPTLTIQLAAPRLFPEVRRLPLGAPTQPGASPLRRGDEADRLAVAVGDVDLARSVLADWGDGPEAQAPRPLPIELPPITSVAARVVVVACCALIDLTLRIGAGELEPLLVLALVATFALDARRHRDGLAAAVASHRPPPAARAGERRFALRGD